MIKIVADREVATEIDVTFPADRKARGDIVGQADGASALRILPGVG